MTCTGLPLAPPSRRTPRPEGFAMRRLFYGLVALAIALACSDSSGPARPVPTSQLNIVLQDPNAPPLLSDSASFYAVMGKDSELRMFYQGVEAGAVAEQRWGI